MRNLWLLVAVLLAGSACTPRRKTIDVGMRPESITRGFGGKHFVTVMNDGSTPGDGVVKVMEGQGKDGGISVKIFASGFDEPKGICFTGKFLVTTDIKRVWKIDERGSKSVLADEKDFPRPIRFLNDTACEPGGATVFVSDMGANDVMRDDEGRLWPLDSPQAKALPAIGRVYRIALDGGPPEVAIDAGAALPSPNGVAAPEKGRLLVVDFFTGNVVEQRGAKTVVLSSGHRGGDGIEQDSAGNIYLSSWTQGKLWKLDRQGQEQKLLAEGFRSAADFYLDEAGKQILLPDMRAGTITFVSLQ
jgi:sugar lactone lactonase YvrE